MRVAVVAGPDAGHALPALALGERLRDSGEEVVFFTGERWFDLARRRGVPVRELVGLDLAPGEQDLDAGRRIHERAARMAALLAPLVADFAPDLVVSDVLTAGGALAAELLGLPWAELSPHPLYLPSKGLPPIGSGLVPGHGVRGRLRDAALRALSARSVRRGLAQRRAAREGIGLPPEGGKPAARLVAALPALEVPRPDWPAEAVLVGPVLAEVSEEELEIPPGEAPLVVLAPSTAAQAVPGLCEAALEALDPAVLGREVRLAVSTFRWSGPPLPAWATAGIGRQDLLFGQAAVVICGGGHGVLAKAFMAGVPAVVVPGGGDQWEVAKRAERLGCAKTIRPLEAAALRDAVVELMDGPSFRAAARRAGDSVRLATDPVAVCRKAAACA
ncbi:MAG: glycosyltransferase [Segniliparus sp.]|uniref:glycosyltransferase n=1 Tax=Segniliparus sp. TaxID=2804064 RepID=UPI003F3568FE